MTRLGILGRVSFRNVVMSYEEREVGRDGRRQGGSWGGREGGRETGRECGRQGVRVEGKKGGQNEGKEIVGGSIWGCGQPFIIYYKIHGGICLEPPPDPRERNPAWYHIIPISHMHS